MANKLRRSMHRRCLRAFYHYVSNNPPSAPCLRVTLLIEIANKPRRSMNRRCLRTFYHYVSNNPPSAPCLRVTLLQTLNTSGKTYHSKILKTR